MADSTPSNPYFRLVIAAGGLFAFTTMAMFATSLGDPNAPPNRFFDAWGLPLLAVETVAVLGISFLAMAVDRRQTLSEQRGTESSSTPNRPSDETPAPTGRLTCPDPLFFRLPSTTCTDS